MAYRYTPKLSYPLHNTDIMPPNFGEITVVDGKNWGMHLGIDISAKVNDNVMSIGRGRVVYAGMHLGEFLSDQKIKRRNWGGIVIIGHKQPISKKIFYSLYGHLGVLVVKKGDLVELGTVIGTIGQAMTPQNGIWESEHLHFGIYTGPFNERVLPGYFKKDNQRTEIDYWENPINFLNQYLEENK